VGRAGRPARMGGGMAVHHESAFGDAIVAALLVNGWVKGDRADYRPDLGLDSALITQIGATQAE
jgi:type I restriction enzyme, R subunit